MNNILFSEERLKYLKLLSKSYKNVNSVVSKIIDLKSVLYMPKATEHFVSDIHGEYEAFYHVINNASGVIKNYITELFNDEMDEEEKAELATIIYYPEVKLARLEKDGKITNSWLNDTLRRLIEMTRRVGSKYNREKITEAFSSDISYILQELIFESPENRHKEQYYKTIFSEIIKMNTSKVYIIELSNLIKRFAVEHLHVLGDIYDRGNQAELVMDYLVNHHDADVQLGNHDIVWYGAYTGSEALIANAIRIAVRYNNLSTLEDGYGINLLPLVTFALETYKDDPCERFIPKGKVTESENDMLSKVHKAISIIQFKAESKIISRHPEFNMKDRDLIRNISSDNKRVTAYGIEYDMLDDNFPTLKNGIEYSDEEKYVIEKLVDSFNNSTRMREHMKFLADKGDIYNIFNDNLLFHGCIPLNSDGSFTETIFMGSKLKGKQLLDVLNNTVKKAFYTQNDKDKTYYNDVLWYLWCGEDSPLFGKTKMTTFERYFIADKETHNEPKNHYYDFRDEEEVMERILTEFGITSEIGKIINGHVPVKATHGENPIKAGGKLIAIDGGFSEAYQSTTGIAGYTLISNSYGLLIATHEPLKPLDEVIDNNFDITSNTEFALEYKSRRRVASTDLGMNIKERITDLTDLLSAYRSGQLQEEK